MEPLAVSISHFPDVLNACVVWGLVCCLPHSHHTHLFKRHLETPSMWLLSPSLILIGKDICSNAKKKRVRCSLSALTVMPFFWHIVLGIKCYRQNTLQGVLFLKPAHFHLKKTQQNKSQRNENIPRLSPRFLYVQSKHPEAVCLVWRNKNFPIQTGKPKNSDCWYTASVMRKHW